MGEERDETHDVRETGVGEAAIAAARLRGTRAALAIAMAVSLAFVISSSAQIIPAVFGLGFTPLPSGSPQSPEGRCGAGIHALADALERAGKRLSLVPSAADDTAAMAALGPVLSPEWDDADAIRGACSQAAGGPAAWASLQRLRVAEEQTGRLDPSDLAAVRRDVAAHLPMDLR